jgi:hypothetical protein
MHEYVCLFWVWVFLCVKHVFTKIKYVSILFFNGCRKATKGTALTPEVDSYHTAMGLPPIASAVFHKAKSFWKNAEISKEYPICLCYPFRDKAWMVYYIRRLFPITLKTAFINYPILSNNLFYITDPAQLRTFAMRTKDFSIIICML